MAETRRPAANRERRVRLRRSAPARGSERNQSGRVWDVQHRAAACQRGPQMTDATRPGATNLSNVVEEAQATASALAAKAQDATFSAVDQHKTAVAEQIGDVAQALDSVAEGVERVLPQAAPYVREAVSGVREASET